MTEIKGDGSVLENINLAPATVYEEVIQNIAVILETVQGSVPLMRDFGISRQNMGRPLQVVENLMVGEIYDQIEEYEPRAIISEVTFEEDHSTGKITPTVILEGVSEEDE